MYLSFVVNLFILLILPYKVFISDPKSFNFVLFLNQDSSCKTTRVIRTLPGEYPQTGQADCGHKKWQVHRSLSDFIAMEV